MPKRQHLHKMRCTAGHNERTKDQKHPVKRDLFAGSIHQISKGSRDRDVADPNNGVSGDMQPN
jgi:hypothetical protein